MVNGSTIQPGIVPYARLPDPCRGGHPMAMTAPTADWTTEQVRQLQDESRH